MADVKIAPGGSASAFVLHEGYAGLDGDDERVAGTVTLILDGDAVIVVDPGMVASREALLSALAAHGPQAGDVTALGFAYIAIVRFGLDVAQQRMPWDELVGRVQFAEDLGFDGAWGFDHFQPMYGEGPGECFEGNTTLAALSGHTERARLGLLVTGMTYRHPAGFAAEAITIEHASGGRLELAYGAAWFDKEHTQLGITFPPDILASADEVIE